MPNLAIEPLTAERAADWTAFFDRDAFADNPEWAGCYCRCFLVPTGDEWMAATPEENRRVMCERVAGGLQRGLLAYADGRVVGWTHAAPLAELPHCHARMRVARPEDADRVGGIVCFVVAKSHRRRGVARGLLEAACTAFARAGLSAVEAYPLREDLADNDAENFYGPLGMYLGAGFAVVAETEKRFVVRKELSR